MNAFRYLCLALFSLSLAGCVALQSTAPGDTSTVGYWTILDYAGETRQVHSMLADVPRLLSLDSEAARREQTDAAKQFAAEDSEANRLHLAWLMSLDIGGRNDVMLLSLVDEANAPPAPAASPLRQFRLMIRRYTLERIRGQRDAQTRGDAHQHDVEIRLREAQARADDLQQKLDALIEVDRALNKRLTKPRKDQP